MKVMLMNKNTQILEAEYNSATSGFTKIYEVYNIDYAPYILNFFYIKDDINNTIFRTNLSD
ncbi:MAG: hypothetical protein IJR82_03695 [Bacilli bacterium]|nr:hypothetical protein [Bacilli bacterium]